MLLNSKEQVVLRRQLESNPSGLVEAVPKNRRLSDLRGAGIKNMEDRREKQQIVVEKVGPARKTLSGAKELGEPNGAIGGT